MSRRRFYWSTVAILAMATCVLVRPMRSWIDQAFVYTMVNRGLAVHELHLHSADNVIEVRGLAWGNTNQHRSYGLNAERTWLAFDPVPLVDRNWHLANVVLRDARIFLRDYTPEPESTTSIWQQELARHVAQLDWNEVKQHFTSLLAADGMAERWESRIQTWLNESESLMERSREIESEIGSLENPLRYEEQVRRRMAEVETLRAKQERLMNQFDGLRRLLDAEIQRLEELFQNDNEWLAENAPDLLRKTLAGNEIDNDQNGLADLSDDLLDSVTLQVWKRYSPYMEVASRLADGPDRKQIAELDRDLRVTRAPAVSFRKVSASGMFELGDTLTPFSLTGRYVKQLRRESAAVDYEWSYAFQSEAECIGVVVFQSGEEALRRVSLNPTLDALPSSNQTLAALSDRKIMGQLVSSGEAIQGQLTLEPACLAELAIDDEASDMVFKSLTADSKTPIRIDVKGNWSTPTFVAPELRNQLLEHLRQNTQPDIQGQLARIAQQLEGEFFASLEPLENQTQRANDRQDLLASGMRAQLMAAQEKLELRLGEISGAPIR